MGVIIAIIVIVVILAIAFGVYRYMQQQKVATASQRFGTEYDRTVQQYGGDKNKAASALQEKEDELQRVTIHPLSTEQREQYAQEWHDVQAKFVDDPGGAVTDADALITEVLTTLGYPADRFGNREDVASVKYPDVADNYRTAHAIAQRQESGEATTEDLRNAMLGFRSLFDQLVGATQGTTTETT
jgi:type II secretory pathway pseudopilin PulG